MRHAELEALQKKRQVELEIQTLEIVKQKQPFEIEKQKRMEAVRNRL